MYRRSPILAVVAAFASGFATAQDTPSVTPESDSRLVAVRIENVQDPTISSPLASNRSGAVLEISAENKIVRAQIARQFGASIVSLTVKGPVEEAAEKTTLATLDGLADSFSARFGITRVAWRRPKSSRKFAKDEGRICSEYARVIKKATFDHYKEDCDEQYFGDDDAWRRKFERVHWGDVPIYLFNGHVETGRKLFKYIEQDSLLDAQVTHNSVAAGAAFGVLTPNEYLLGFGYRYEKTYDGGSSSQVCRPLGSEGALECKTRPLGPPERTEGHIGFAEIRKLSRTIAINPRISHNFSDDVTGFDLPVYFFKNPDGEFAGGIRLGWLSKDNKVTLTAFFGPAPPLTQ